MDLQTGDVLVSISDAAATLAVNASTMRRHAQAGLLEAELIGRSWVTTQREVERYRSEHLGRAGMMASCNSVVAVPLDDTQLGYFVLEVELQCSLALHAYLMVNESLGIEEKQGEYRKRVEGTIAYCHTMLTHAGNLSKLLWPSRPFHRDGETEQEYRQRAKNQEKRGKQLRAALQIAGTSPLKSRKVRDHLEHYDERLETYLRRSHRGGLLDMAFETPWLTGQDVHRLYNPALKEFVFERDRVALIPLSHAIRDVRDAAREWLYEHGGWDREEPDAWYNAPDYTLSLIDYLHPDEVAYIRERREKQWGWLDEALRNEGTAS